MKPLVMTEDSWLKLRHHLIQTYPKSVMLTRWKMRKVLGFTDRLHTARINTVDQGGGMVYEHREVHLDFFDEPKRTMFLLKYTDWIKDGKDSLD